MIFTLGNIVNSIAGVLAGHYPEAPVYSNQNQQGTKVPCFFVFFMPTEMKNRIGPRFIRDIGIDIVYLTERNTPDALDLMTDIADTLDRVLEFVPYTDGKETQKIRAFDREWKTDDGELHYQFHLKVFVAYPDKTPNIGSLESYKEGVKDG